MGLWLCKMCCAKDVHENDDMIGVTLPNGQPHRLASQDDYETSDSAAAVRRFKILLIGVSGAGKTELGHCLSRRQRDIHDHGPTNGARFFPCQHTISSSGHDNHHNQTAELALTEVGGSKDMQRLWSHYYTTACGFIYCFDLSSDYQTMSESFTLLQNIIMAQVTVRRKCILIVGTRAQASACEGVQLYDVENTFGLEALARISGCALRLCFFDVLHSNKSYVGGSSSGSGRGSDSYITDVWSGMDWLLKHLVRHERALIQRIKYDVNIQCWHQKYRVLLDDNKLRYAHQQRFHRQRKIWPISAFDVVRPHTAPSSIFTISGKNITSSTTTEATTSNRQMEEV